MPERITPERLDDLRRHCESRPEARLTARAGLELIEQIAALTAERDLLLESQRRALVVCEGEPVAWGRFTAGSDLNSLSFSRELLEEGKRPGWSIAPLVSADAVRKAMFPEHRA